MKIRLRIYSLALLAGGSMWALHSIFGYVFYYESSLVDLLVSDVPPHELYTRLLLLGGFFVLAEVISRLLAGRERDAVKLSESARFRKTLLKAYPAPIFYKDTEGRYLGINAAFEEYFGFTEEEVCGKTVYELFDRDYAAVDSAKDQELFRRGGSQRYEKRIRTKGDVFRDVQVEKSLYYDTQGDCVGLIGAIIDVTEERKAQAELLDSQEAAESAIKAKDEFLAVMSHEIRTPLNPILGFSTMLLEDCESDLDRECLEIIINSANIQLKLIDQMLTYTKMVRNTIACSPEVFSPVELAKDALANYSVNSSKIDTRFANGGTCDPIPENLLVKAEESVLIQVLGNLIENAIKYTKEGSVTVRVGMETSEREGAVFRFEVIDTGIGIDPSMHSSIFEAFCQADSSHTREFGGLGLGLAICRKMIESIDGSIDMTSELGKGSRFWFDAPLTICESEGEEDAASLAFHSADAGDLAGLSVLVVDDVDSNALMVKAALERSEMNATLVSSGEAAIEVCQHQKFDRILMDLTMGGISGFEATEAILGDGLNRDTKIIALTADATDETREQWHSMGMDHFIVKPKLGHELVAALRED